MYKEALNILNILFNNGYESYIVGGFVRDKLLGINNDDIDIITSAKPSEINKVFNTNIKDEYASIKLNYNGYTFDITTFRKEENYYDYRRPDKIEYVSSVLEDLKRRDFTINTILIDKDENIIDYLNGVKDLNDGIIRSVLDPSKKIKQDALRILRALRFSSIYNFKIEEELLQAIKNNKDNIKNISFDRIKKELDLIFSSFNANLFFNMCNSINLYKILEIKPKNDVICADNYLLVWAQLDYSDNYNFSNKEKEYIKSIRYILDNKIDNYTVYKYGVNLNKEANKILKQDINIDEIYNNLQIKDKKDIDIKYDEILEVVNNKNILNKIYIDLEKLLVYNKLNNKKEDIISYLEGDYIE